jgi:hypothetical protein
MTVIWAPSVVDQPLFIPIGNFGFADLGMTLHKPGDLAVDRVFGEFGKNRLNGFLVNLTVKCT